MTPPGERRYSSAAQHKRVRGVTFRVEGTRPHEVKHVATKKKSRKTQPFGPLMAPGHARLTIVAGECPTGITYSLSATDHEAGRKGKHIVLSEDNTVSEKHATFSYRKGVLVVTDEGSLNGIYVRIRGPKPLTHGDMFRVGGQFFRFDELEGAEEFPTDDGTLFFTSPRRKGSFRVVQILDGGKTGMSSTSSKDELSIGGEGATVAFTADPFLSELHCKISKNSTGSFAIEDLGSTNGTYVRVDGKESLAHGDYVYIGNELLRVEII